MAISGTTAVVGVDVGTDLAAADVFTKTGAVWKQVAELKPPLTPGMGSFGVSVAISGTTAIVGATEVGSGGRAYVFEA